MSTLYITAWMWDILYSSPDKGERGPNWVDGQPVYVTWDDRVRPVEIECDADYEALRRDKYAKAGEPERW